MQHFAFNRDGGAYVIPACNLADGQHVAIAQLRVRIGIAGQGPRQLHR